VYDYLSPTNALVQTIQGAKEPDTAIWINGSLAATRDWNTQWSADISLDTEGDNAFQIVAVNAINHQSDPFNFTITRKTTAPAITVTSPPSGSEIYHLPIAVHIASDIPDALIFMGTERVYPLGGNEYMIWIDTLKEGSNLFTIEATDELGNSQSCGYSLTYLPYEAGPDYQLFCLHDDILPYDPAQPMVNSALDIEFQVYNNGAAVAGESVTIELLSGSGSLSTTSATTDAEGKVITTLTTGTTIDEPDVVRAALSNFLSTSSEVTIYSRSDAVDHIDKLSSETENYAIGALVDLRVKVLDQYNNPISDSPLSVSVDSGLGFLLTDSVVTNENGEASVSLETDPTVVDTTLVRFTSLSQSGLNVIYTIETFGDASAVTVEQIMQKVEDNAARVHDIQANITIRSTDKYLPPFATMHIWQKGDLQKIEQYTPTNETFIRPQPEPYSGPLPPRKVRTIHMFDAQENLYVIKMTEEGQSNPYPYTLDYVDYEKGVIVKTEYYEVDDMAVYCWVIERNNFANINGSWLFQNEDEMFYFHDKLINQTEKDYSDFVVNGGIADSVFNE
jgi:hypothetical protein